MPARTDEKPSTGSLADRMAARRAQGEQQHTKFWPVPGWRDLVAVELRVLSVQTLMDIGQRAKDDVQKDSLAQIYTMADSIIRATVGFHQVMPDGSMVPERDATWITLARAGVESLPDDLTSRQALFALLDDDVQLVDLAREWSEWMNRDRRKVDAEVVQDFPTTG